MHIQYRMLPGIAVLTALLLASCGCHPDEVPSPGASSGNDTTLTQSSSETEQITTTQAISESVRSASDTTTSGGSQMKSTSKTSFGTTSRTSATTTKKGTTTKKQTRPTTDTKWPTGGMFRNYPKMCDYVDGYATAYLDHLDYNYEAVYIKEFSYADFWQYCQGLLTSGLSAQAETDLPASEKDVEEMAVLYTQEKQGTWLTAVWYKQMTGEYRCQVTVYDKNPLGRYQILT